MYDNRPTLDLLANHRSRHQDKATSKMDCLPGDCIWPLNLPHGFFCGYVWVNIHFHLTNAKAFFLSSKMHHSSPPNVPLQNNGENSVKGKGVGGPLYSPPRSPVSTHYP